MDAHARVRVCSTPASSFMRWELDAAVCVVAAFFKSSGRASFMRWELDASVCVHVCIYVDIALVHGCAHCRRVREGTMGHA